MCSSAPHWSHSKGRPSPNHSALSQRPGASSSTSPVGSVLFSHYHWKPLVKSWLFRKDRREVGCSSPRTPRAAARASTGSAPSPSWLSQQTGPHASRLASSPLGKHNFFQRLRTSACEFFEGTIVSEVERELGSRSWWDILDGALQNLNESSKPVTTKRLSPWMSPRYWNN